MERLAFTLPDFCRVSWASEASRARWNPVIEQTKCLWQRLEVNTVQTGMRRAALISVESVAFERYEARLARRGLSLKTLYSFEAKGLYVSDANISNIGLRSLVCAVGSARDVFEVNEAFTNNRDDVLGEMLGYPPCCIRFFDEIWNRDGYIDTTWSMAVRSSSTARPTEFDVEARVRPENNMLLRWLGVRPVFHLPCCLDCQGTFELASQIRDVAKETGDLAAVTTLYDLLQWPVQWSALHGIAEIETPVLRISTRTDATAKKYTVRLHGGEQGVSAAPTGNRFPFLARAADAAARRNLIQIPIGTVKRNALQDQTWYHKDNGFHSRIDMERAFIPVVKALSTLGGDSILHLACKNGALLHKAVELRESVSLFGVDTDEGKIQRAKLLLPKHAPNLRTGAFYDDAVLEWIAPVDVCVLMLGRFLEIPAARAKAVLNVIQSRSRAILVYAFDDWLRKQSLPEMATVLGLKLSDCGDADNVVVGLVRTI